MVPRSARTGNPLDVHLLTGGASGRAGERASGRAGAQSEGGERGAERQILRACLCMIVL